MTTRTVHNRRYLPFIVAIALSSFLALGLVSCRQPNVQKQLPEKPIEQVAQELKLELGEGSIHFSRGISSIDIITLGREKVIRVRYRGDRATDNPNIPSWREGYRIIVEFLPATTL